MLSYGTMSIRNWPELCPEFIILASSRSKQQNDICTKQTDSDSTSSQRLGIQGISNTDRAIHRKSTQASKHVGMWGATQPCCQWQSRNKRE
eukprot:6214824-Pleurochrysis_carterae.AAC.4